MVANSLRFICRISAFFLRGYLAGLAASTLCLGGDRAIDILVLELGARNLSRSVVWAGYATSSSLEGGVGSARAGRAFSSVAIHMK